MAKRNEATLAQQLWLAEFVRNGGNATAAARVAYPDAAPTTQERSAMRNKNNPFLKEELARITQKAHLSMSDVVRSIRSDINDDDWRCRLENKKLAIMLMKSAADDAINITPTNPFEDWTPKQLKAWNSLPDHKKVDSNGTPVKPGEPEDSE